MTVSKGLRSSDSEPSETGIGSGVQHLLLLFVDNPQKLVAVLPEMLSVERFSSRLRSPSAPPGVYHRSAQPWYELSLLGFVLMPPSPTGAVVKCIHTPPNGKHKGVTKYTHRPDRFSQNDLWSSKVRGSLITQGLWTQSKCSSSVILHSSSGATVRNVCVWILSVN